MISIDQLKSSFESQPLPYQWGSVASDLMRISSTVSSGMADQELFENVLTETKLFTEWIAPKLSLNEQKMVLSLQYDLSKWSSDSVEESATDIAEWSEKILETSGLAG